MNHFKIIDYIICAVAMYSQSIGQQGVYCIYMCTTVSNQSKAYVYTSG